jgi:hypothetical protein
MSENGEDPEFDVLGTLSENDLQDGEEESEVHQTCRRLIEDVWHKKYEREDIANARNHQWDDSAYEAVDLGSSDSTPIDILEELREGSDFENNSVKLTELFLQQVREVPNAIAVLDLLIFGRFTRGEEEFITVIKTPYIDDAYNINPDAEDILTENEQVIREQTDKSLLYPRHDGIDEEIDNSKVQVFQKQGSSNWANYWYEFIDLEENKYPDELVESTFKNRAAEGDNNAVFSSYSVFDETDLEEEFDTDGDLNNGDVSIQFAGERLKISIEKIRSDDRVQLARSNDSEEYYLILKDTDPEFPVGPSGSTNPLFDDISDLPVIQDLF